MPSAARILTWVLVVGIIVGGVVISYLLLGRFFANDATVTPSVSILDKGQSAYVGVSWSGGSGPYTITLYSSLTDSCSTTSHQEGSKLVAVSHFAFAISPSITTRYCGTVSSAKGSSGVSPSVLVTVKPTLHAPKLDLYPLQLDKGQTAGEAANVTIRGGAPPYTIILYSGLSSACSSDKTIVNVTSKANPVVGLVGVNSTLFQFSSPGASTYFCAAVVDAAHSTSSPIYSSAVEFLVVGALSATITPAPPTLDSGQSTTFTVIPVHGTPAYSYQWSTGSTCSSPISGQTTSKFSTGGLKSSGSFSVMVTDSSKGTPRASVCAHVAITVNPQLSASSIRIEPHVVSIDSNQTASLAVTWSGGTPPYSAYLLTNGSPDCPSATPNGMNATGITGTNATFSDTPTATTYYCVTVTDSASTPVTINSTDPATVNVNSVLAPQLSISPTAQNAGQTTSVTATVDLSTGTAPYSVTLFSGFSSACDGDTNQVGNPLNGVNDTSATFTFQSPSVSTYYCATVTDSSASPSTASSPAAQFNVNPSLSASISPVTYFVDSGQSATIAVLASGGTPGYSYQWYAGSGCSSPISGEASSQFATGPLLSNGTYSVLVKDSSPGSPAQSVCVFATTVVKPALRVSFRFSPVATEVGSSVTIKANVNWTGGISPYSVTLLSGSSPGCASDTTVVTVSAGPNPVTGMTTRTMAFSFPSPGASTYYCASVKDASTSPVTTLTPAVQFTVNQVLSTVTLAVTPNVLDFGQKTTIAATVAWTGGAPPFSVTLYSGSSSACSSDTTVVSAASNPRKGVTANNSTFTFSAPGSTTYYCASVGDSVVSKPISSAASLFTINPAMSVTQPILAPTFLDGGQSSTVTAKVTWSGGTSPYTATLYASPSAACPTGGAVVSVIPGSNPQTGLTATSASFSFPSPFGSTYYCVTVTDSSSVQSLVLSPYSLFTVVPAPVPPKITVSPAVDDVGQSSTLSTAVSFTGGTSPYTCQWLVESPSATTYSNLGSTFACSTISFPTTSTGALSAPGTWHFELKVTDSAGTPVSVTSTAVAVSVNTDPAATVSVSPPAVDTGYGGNLTVTITWSGGVGPYTVALFSGSSATCSSDTILVPVANPPNPKGGLLGSVFMFKLVPAPSSTTYFCVSLTDGAPVPFNALSSTAEFIVNPPLSVKAPLLSPTVMDAGQTSPVTAAVSWTGGNSTYTAWLYRGSGSSCSSPALVTVSPGTSNPQTHIKSPAAIFTYSPPAAPGGAYYCLKVQDSFGSIMVSAAALLTVNAALSLASSTITAPAVLDSGEKATLSASSFSGGTSPFTCQWLQKAPGASAYGRIGSSLSCTQSSVPSVAPAVSVIGIWFFELRVNDSSGVPVSATSTAVSTIVNYAPSVVLHLSPDVRDYGASRVNVTGLTTWAGGTGPFTVKLVSGSSSNCSNDYLTVTLLSGSNPRTGLTGTNTTFKFLSPISTTFYCISITDSASVPFLSFSPSTVFTISPPIVHSPATLPQASAYLAVGKGDYYPGYSVYLFQRRIV